MSIYDKRSGAAYGSEKTDPHYAENRYILEWWSADHDALLTKLISEWQWLWEWNIVEEIEKTTDQKCLKSWQKRDPLCRKYAWYNVLMYFCKSRAETLGYTKKIRFSKRKTCPLCGHTFTENSIPFPVATRLGMNNLDFCSPCMSTRVLQGSGNDKLDHNSIIVYLSDLTHLLGRVPPQGFGEGLNDLKGVDRSELQKLLELLGRKPSTKRVKEVFGTWLQALIAAQVLENATRKTSRGTQCVAEDGHICLSLGEKTIDDFLYRNGIGHTKEPHYPEGGYRGDFLVGEAIIEYFGLVGNPEYDAKISIKKALCKKHKIRLVAIYPVDLIIRNKLSTKLLALKDH